MCWAGRQEIVAVIAVDEDDEGLEEVSVLTVEEVADEVEADAGERLSVQSSHQSSSVTLVVILLSVNHFFRPSGTKKCAFG